MIRHNPLQKMWGLAQMVERRAVNAKVAGSRPAAPANYDPVTTGKCDNDSAGSSQVRPASNDPLRCCHNPLPARFGIDQSNQGLSQSLAWRRAA